MNLVPLFEEALEFQDYNGTVLSDGKVAVYYIGRTRLADIYEDVAAEYPAENPRILNNLGMGPVYVNPAFDYEMVVFDAYGSELFSVKKYLASKGEHSTANVVVTPSESIAVSAWTVGDVQVYMPYLTGQLGKVYTGIDPIVVNNVEDKISANHVPLGVQDPLYFVQDDEEGCIIGFSGEALPEGTMNESAFGYEDGQITSYNGSAFSAGNSYEAGSYIDITNNTISVVNLPTSADVQNIVDVATSGLMPSGDYLTKESADTLYAPTGNYLTGLPEDLVYSADITGFATTAQLDEKLDKSDSGKFYPMDSNPSGYLTAHQDISNKLDTTAFSTVSGDFLTAIPSEYVTENTLQSGLSSKLDSTAFSTVSGSFLTAHQSLDGLMSADLLEISDNKITGYNGTAFAGQGGVSGDFELSAGSGISIVDYPLEQKTVISVTAQGGNPEVEQAVIDNSATWNTVSDKLDTTAFSDVSGTFLTAHQDLSNYATTAQLADKVDSSAIGIREASVNLISSISGIRLSAWTADNASYASTAGRANRDSLGNIITATYMTAVPAGTMNESAFGYDANDKISGYNGSAFAGGSDVPEGVMVESGLEYNAVNEISGYNGSAIAQYGAEKQWLVHDDTLVHASNSAQYALGVNLSAVAQLLGIDETVLWSGSPTTFTTAFTASESISNFDKIKVSQIIYTDNEYLQENHEYETDSVLLTNKLNVGFNYVIDNGWKCWGAEKYHITNGTDFTMYRAGRNFIGPNTTAGQGYNDTIQSANGWVYKVIGIGRRSKEV